MEIVIRAADGLPPDEQPIEVVERKGLGHPDTLCDGIAEQVSQALCRYYQERFGLILHHNVDKVLLVGGAARAELGGGEVTEPMEIYLAGRVTLQAFGERIPADDLAVEACRSWLRRRLPCLDVDRHVRIVPRLRPGSTDLAALFDRERTAPLANDTSCGVGFAPLSRLERTVLAVDRALSSEEVRRRHQEIGQDIKVMGLRSRDRISLTISCAFLSSRIASLAAYQDARQAVRELAVSAAASESPLAVDAVVNAADDLSRGEIFLTVTGTSAESGDDGEVGRGNRTNGLITPYRSMSLEAAPGKNPVSHVGKLYNLAAARITSRLVERAAGIEGACCALLSRIGQPVSDPQIADLSLHVPGGVLAEPARREAGDAVREVLSHLDALRDDLLAGRIAVY